MRKKLAAGNWKMNLTPRETVEYIKLFRERIPVERTYDVALFPPFIDIPFLMGNLLERRDIHVGGQNLSEKESGAFTGEISGNMLADAGCTMVLVGHSERRQFFGETDELLGKKLIRAFTSGLLPVFCLGETLEQRKAGHTFAVLDKQLTALTDVTPDLRDKLILAYEPVWAIGTGVTASPAQAQEAHKYLRERLRGLWGNVAETTRILYGGSVTPANAKELFGCADVDGGLVGGASLKVDSFQAICEAAA
ncbi:MAG: triose-phosphate isomerase [bacterium]|nr:triose-phosphate isomerase [bacterium]